MQELPPPGEYMVRPPNFCSHKKGNAFCGRLLINENGYCREHSKNYKHENARRTHSKVYESHS